MIETEEIIRVICDHCGKVEEYTINEEARIAYDSEVQAEQHFLSGLKDEGWTHDDEGEAWACPNCELGVEPFQKPDEEINVEIGYDEEDIKEDKFKDDDLFPSGSRATGRFFNPNPNNEMVAYVEVERKRDGEKFWVAV